MQGRRVEFKEGARPIFAPGDYGLVDGTWYAKTPNGYLADLSRHGVELNIDGTITVAPSIKVTVVGMDGKRVELWHGYLEGGVFRNA